jgi:hypothetical protein
MRDLVPLHDPKGGSPRSPARGIPVKELVHYTNGNGTVWKVWVSILCSLLVGMIIAWYTALQGKGVSPIEMQSYVEKYTPYSHDKELIALQQSSQDTKIGELMGKVDRIFDRLTKMDEKNLSYDRDILDDDHKIKLLTDYIEAEKIPRK